MPFKVGFSGFCFLLALLSFLLLKNEQKQKQVRKEILDSIQKYMKFAIGLGLIVLFSSIMPLFFMNNRTEVDILKRKMKYYQNLISEKDKQSLDTDYEIKEIKITEPNNGIKISVMPLNS